MCNKRLLCNRCQRAGMEGEQEVESWDLLPSFSLSSSLQSPLSSPLPTCPQTPNATPTSTTPSPVYEGGFMGLAGAVSCRWPLPLPPQQGFALHVCHKRLGGPNGRHPSLHSCLPSTHTHTSNPYCLPARPPDFRCAVLSPRVTRCVVFLLLSPRLPPPTSTLLLLLLTLYCSIQHLLFYWSTRSS